MSRSKRRALLSAALLLAGMAVPGDAQPREVPLAEACPNLTAAQIAGIQNYRGQFAENAHYARAYCVPIEKPSGGWRSRTARQ